MQSFLNKPSLIFDIGNSYLKAYYLTFQNYKLKFVINLKQINFSLVYSKIKSLQIKKIFYSCPNQKWAFIIQKIQKHFLSLKIINLNNLKIVRQKFKYAPKDLGIDLKMLIFGANINAKNTIIVNLGSATTILTIINHKFIGCLITPGLMFNYHFFLKTTNLKPKQQLNYLPTTVISNKTNTALNLGFINFHYYAIMSTITKIKQYYQDKDFKIIFTSYQKKYFLSFFKNIIFDGNLFIKGVYQCLYD